MLVAGSIFGDNELKMNVTMFILGPFLWSKRTEIST